MEKDQIIKRLEWLDEERRKDKATIAALQERLAAYEGSLNVSKDQIKQLDTKVSKFSTIKARMDQFDGVMAQQRTDLSRQIDEAEKSREKTSQDTETRRHQEVDNLNKSIADLRKNMDAITELRKQVQSVSDAETRFNRAFTDQERKLEDITRIADEVRHTGKMLEENRKQDVKRVSDLQGEVASIRKRVEEQRDKNEVNSDTIKHLDTRINELLSTEGERKQSQRMFIEQQSLVQVERDRAWKEMQTRYEVFNKQAIGLENTLQNLDEMNRSVKKSKETFDELNSRIERRINEVTEMQRLAEDRMRQEWVTFKADDQKRWTNYTLSHDETYREIRADIEKISERIASLDDAAQNQADLLQQTTEATENSLQELMNWSHEFLSNFERVMGHSRPTK
jgi:chromosome segregation ATPase